MIQTPLDGCIDYVSATTVRGWAWDPGRPNEPLVIEISGDGQPVTTISADRYRRDLLEAGIGDGRHAFKLELPEVCAAGAVLSARVRGSGFELKRSPFRCGPPQRDPGSHRAGDSRRLESLESAKREMESFSREWRPRMNETNRLAAASARDGGLTHVDARPQWFMIETTSHCNLKCVICPHGHDAMPLKLELDTSNFSRNLDFVAAADRMQLFGTGEPLMSRAFWEILESIDPASDTEVSINSNGTLLDAERIDRLLRSPLSSISVSLDAVRADTYRHVRGGNFDLVISRVRDLIRERNRRPRLKRLAVFVNLTLMRENIEEFPQFVDLAADLGADGVQVCQLLWHEAHRTWAIQKGDWRFVYSDQLLRNIPETARASIGLALERGVKRKIRLVFDASQFDGSSPILQWERA